MLGFVDEDAASLTAPFEYFDVAFIEFKFVPTTDFLSFDYVFFSEEYCFAINSSFGNDAFGFFLTGPDGVTRNIATLPNGDPITATTLNHTTFPSLFLDNSPPGSFSPCTGDPIPPERLAGISYDGFSTKLTASATVTPCDTHTLKLVVVDAFDNFIDSGVLLEAGSFTAGLISDPEPSVQGTAGSTEPVEGCDIATITFERLFFEEEDLMQPLEVNYNIISSGDLNGATQGVDYELPPSPSSFPPAIRPASWKFPSSATWTPTRASKPS
ncbi:MAG: choice-of-anchor L domain-containing protein [Bacteroidota bacterium]